MTAATGDTPVSTVGILGVGRVGVAVARLADSAGLRVRVAGSGDPARIVGAIARQVPGASAVWAADACDADVVILAIPLGRYRELPREALMGVLVIDAMNYWWELDGQRPDLADPRHSTSEAVQDFLVGSRVVKSLNHVSAYALEELAVPVGAPGRLAVAVAGNTEIDVETVASLVDSLGFDPVHAGSLADGVRFEPGTDLFGSDATAAEAREMLGRFWDSQRGRVVARARFNADGAG